MICDHCGNDMGGALKLVPGVRPPSVECSRCHRLMYYSAVDAAVHIGVNLNACKICGRSRLTSNGLCRACETAPVESPTPHIPRLSIAAAMLAGDDSVATVVLTQEHLLWLLQHFSPVRDAKEVRGLYQALKELHSNARAVIVFRGSWDRDDP